MPRRSAFSWHLTGVQDKRPRLGELAEAHDVPLSEVCYVGDDLVDLSCLQSVGFPVAVSNARDEVKSVASYVTERAGGDGAFREIAEHISAPEESGKA